MKQIDTPTPKVALIRGDGIGPEIMDATLQMMDAAGARLSYQECAAGLGAMEQFGAPLPEKTLETIAACGVALKGPLTTPKGEGFRSVNVGLRQHFDLYANVRPAQTIEGIPCRFTKVDIVTVRENTEDLYAGIEHYVGVGKQAAESIAVITRFASERIVNYAFAYAKAHQRKKVTLVHKANIMKLSNGLFLDVGREVAKQHPDILFDDMMVDAACMKLVVAPEQFDVIVTTNLFGDILSDLVSGLVGGLGVTPGANLGERAGLFEAVHGSAPDIAGQGVANPTALALAGAMMLDHVGQSEAAARLRGALYQALRDPRVRTKDLGGSGTTKTFTEAVVLRLKQENSESKRSGTC